jgi:hypothetical protein
VALVNIQDDELSKKMLLSPEKEKPPPRGRGLITVHGHRHPWLYRRMIVI